MSRIIRVDRCAPDECPFCIPDSYQPINWCHGFENTYQKVSNKVKTFPNLCPLEKE